MAAVPRNPGIDAGQGSLEALVGVAGNGGAGDETAGLEAAQEVAPVDLGLGEGVRDVRDGAFAVVLADAPMAVRTAQERTMPPTWTFS